MIRALLFSAFFLVTFISASAAEDDCSELTVAECVQRISQIARDLNDKFDAVFRQINRSEVPVGTIVTSPLPPDVFLNANNPQYDPTKWVPADGRALPANTIYQQISGQANAPDLRSLSQQKVILDVVTGAASHGQNIAQLRTPEFASAKWNMHFGVRDMSGNRYNNDWEQDTDQFQIYDENGTLRAVGRTFNWKHNQWGSWTGGHTNYLGIATINNPLHYYVKIN